MQQSLEEPESETIFITGGAGFIGSALAERLIRKNKVIIFDNFSRNSLQNSSVFGHRNLVIVRGDVLNPPTLVEAMQVSTMIIHCAGITGIDTVIKHPVQTMEVNMIGSAYVLRAALRLQGCKRVVCFSTSEVFGPMAFQPEETTAAVLGAAGEARSTYAVSKLAEEHLAYAYLKQFGLPTVTIRPFNVYGPGQVGESAIRTFIVRALWDEPLEIHGDGTQIRAWCYIDDMIDAVLRVLTNERAVGESFNIGNQRAVTTIHGLANAVIRILGSRSEIRFVPKLSADIDLRIPSVEKARRLLGFEARVDLEEGILRTAEYFRRQP